MTRYLLLGQNFVNDRRYLAEVIGSEGEKRK